MSRLKALLQDVKQLTPIKQRAVAAMVGATVADAATRPLHWVYNQDTLDAVLRSMNHPEFCAQNKSPFYDIPLGQTSCYNDELKCALFHLEKNSSGILDSHSLCGAFEEMFGEGTAYDIAYKSREQMKGKGPVPGPWIQKGILKMLESFRKGEPFNFSDGNEHDALMASLPLLLNGAGSPSLWDDMKKIMLLFSTHQETLSFFFAEAILIEECILGNADPFAKMKTRLRDSQPSVLQTVEKLESQKDQRYIATVASNGKACYLPGSFLGAYLAMLQTTTYRDAVRLNITAGGCSCSRANVIGACYGARYGLDNIPREWMDQVTDLERVLDAAINVAKFS